MKACARQVDLCPPPGGWMTGFAARTSASQGTHDPLMASALLLDDGERRLVIVSCDLIGLSAAAAGQIRDGIEAATGGFVPAGHVLIVCTHTHSGPASLPFRGVMGYMDHGWMRETRRRIVDMVAGLCRDLVPARIAHGDVMVEGIGFNRQDASRPIDDQLNVIAVEDRDGAGIATLAGYATHAVVLGHGNLLYSADYPGELARGLAAARGGIGMFLPGACGDADPVVNRDRGWGTGTFEDARDIGQRLTAAAMTALRGVRRRDDLSITVRGRRLEILLDPLPTADALRGLVEAFETDRRRAREAGTRAEELIAEAMLDWASEVRHAPRAPGEREMISAELFFASLSELCIVGVPFEPYSEIALELRRRMQPRPALLAGYANGLYGYCASRRAKEQGGYGPYEACRWFPRQLAPVSGGMDELIVEQAVALAHAAVPGRQRP